MKKQAGNTRKKALIASPGFLVSFTLMLILFIPFYRLSGQETSISRGSGASETTFSGAVGSGARALGMGGAFIAVADDATAASWNPAGLAQLEKPELSLVLRYQTYHNMIPASLERSGDFRGAMDFKGTAESFDFASFTYPIRIGNFKIVPQVSYQRAISFDMVNNERNVRISNTLNESSMINALYNADRTLLQKITGGLDTLTFSLATTLFSRFHIGVSANVWINGYTMDEIKSEQWELDAQTSGSFISAGEYQENIGLNFDMKGLNLNAGILINVMDNLKFGLVYKSGFSANMGYRFSFSTSGTHPVLPTDLNYRINGRSRLHWPDTWGIGIAFMPTDRLTLSADITGTMWSKSKFENFLFFLDDENRLEPGGDVFFPTMAEVDNESGIHQKDTQQLRFGFEYIFFSQDMLIPIRFGIFTDSQFYPDAVGDEVVFFGITAGVGLKKGHIAVDAAIQYEFGSYIETSAHYADTRFSELRLYLSTIYSF